MSRTKDIDVDLYNTDEVKDYQLLSLDIQRKYLNFSYLVSLKQKIWKTHTLEKNSIKVAKDIWKTFWETVIDELLKGHQVEICSNPKIYLEIAQSKPQQREEIIERIFLYQEVIKYGTRIHTSFILLPGLKKKLIEYKKKGYSYKKSYGY